MSLAYTNETIPVNTLFSVCTAKDLHTWQVNSLEVVRNIYALNYLVVVPDSEVDIFKSLTDPHFQILAESKYIGNLKERLEGRMTIRNRDRLGWYLQQFIKLAVLKESKENEVFLIWDADTVPLKPLNFIGKDSRILFYKGLEHHAPYFDFIDRLLGLKKTVDHSWISQCFACRGKWAREFFEAIESLHEKDWITAILDLIDFEQDSGFSEYETIGTFLSHQYANDIQLIKNKWLRHGNGYIGSIENLNRFPHSWLKKKYDFVAFETWDKPYQSQVGWPRKIINIIARKSLILCQRKRLSLESFLSEFFS